MFLITVGGVVFSFLVVVCTKFTIPLTHFRFMHTVCSKAKSIPVINDRQQPLHVAQEYQRLRKLGYLEDFSPSQWHPSIAQPPGMEFMRKHYPPHKLVALQGKANQLHG